VREVVDGEDHNRARATDHVLATVRNTAISQFRMHGRPGSTAAERFASANRYRRMSWLVCQSMN
jgi:hypothetical protein